VDEKGGIIAGHGRVLAAQKLGLNEVPAMTAAGWTEAQKKAYVLADNKLALNAGWDTALLRVELTELAELDFDMPLIGFDDDELAALLAETTDGLTDPDEVPEPPLNPVTVDGDVWLLGKHRIVCGDSTKADVLNAIAANDIDCVFTSPPYAVGIEYGEYKDTIDNLRLMLPLLAAEWMARVVPGGFAITNFGDIVAAQKIVGSKEPCEYPMALEYWPVFRAVGWNLWTRRIWKKPHARVNSPWVMQSSRASADWEHVWVWKKPGKDLTGRGNFSAFGVWDSEGGHGVDVGKTTHGAGMPVAIATKSLETYSRPGKRVMEPFSGTGTTIIAGEMTGRHVYAIELSPAYVDVAIKRWQDFTGKTATLDATGQSFDDIKAERLKGKDAA
jgi:DNA modification methylase